MHLGYTGVMGNWGGNAAAHYRCIDILNGKKCQTRTRYGSAFEDFLSRIIITIGTNTEI